MIRVIASREPDNFDEEVRQPGRLALAELCGLEPKRPRKAGKPFEPLPNAKRPDDIPTHRLPTYWTRALPQLMQAYHEVCAYSCSRIHGITGARTVDHFIPRKDDRKLAYEWSNFRLSCAKMNAKKGTHRVIDPFDPIDGWFELELVFFQMKPGTGLDDGKRAEVLRTIKKLDLKNQSLLDTRAIHAEGYWQGHYSFEHLVRESPFVARELRRLGRLT